MTTRSKLKWAFSFCEKHDQIWAVILVYFIILVCIAGVLCLGRKRIGQGEGRGGEE
jgi:hypothetical protein